MDPTSTASRALPEWTPPEKLEEYELVRLIGRGAMGDVYLARDVLLDRSVAIKFVAAVVPDENARKRFFNEARAIARLKHPNIVTIHRCGETQGHPYLVSELIDGTSMDRLEKPIAGPKVLEIAIALARALAAAHRGGVLHRDIKPANAMITGDGAVKLVDFGLAALIDPGDEVLAAPIAVRPADAAGDDPAKTRSLGVRATVAGEAPGPRSGVVRTTLRELAGTPLYMAPELWRGGAATRRSDIYSLGALLYELCAGTAPHAGVAAPELAERVATQPAPKLAGVAPNVDRGLAELVDRCLERDPELRPEAEALAAALEALRARAAPRRRRVLAAALAAILLTATGGSIAVMRRPAKKPEIPAYVSSARRLTYDAGCEEFPAISPDGRTVYFDSSIERDGDIYALDLATGEQRRLTFEVGWDLGAAVSPDGAWLAYMHVHAGKQELRVRPLSPDAGGEETLSSAIIGWPAWGPEGDIYVGTGTGAVDRFSRENGVWSSHHLVRLPGNRAPRMIAPVSRDRLFVMWRLPSGDAPLTLGFIEPDRTIRELVPGVVLEEAGIALSPSREALYYAQTSRTQTSELVRRGLDGDTFVLTGGISPSAGFTISQDGKTLVYSTCRAFTTIARLTADKPPEPLIRDAAWVDQAPVPIEGDRFLITSDRSGHRRLWNLHLSTLQAVPVGGDHGRHGSISPDRRWIVYGNEVQGGIRVSPLAGGEERRLTDGKDDLRPAFSHDGRTVYFLRPGEARTQLFAVPAAGGEPRLLVDDQVQVFAVSPTEDLIAFVTFLTLGPMIYATDSKGVLRRELLPPPTTTAFYEDIHFSADGKRLLLARNHAEAVEIELAAAPAEPRVLWKTGPEAELSTISYSTRPGELLGTIVTWEGDLWIANGEFR